MEKYVVSHPSMWDTLGLIKHDLTYTAEQRPTITSFTYVLNM